MWQTNKAAICVLMGGLALVGLGHWYLLGVDADLARKELSLGVCFMLLGVGSWVWFSARKGM